MAGKGKDEEDDEGNGGSGGGGSNPFNSPESFPAFMPGQADMLAQQIGMGFGQDPAAVLNYLNQIYKPVQMAAPSSSGGDDDDKGSSSEQMWRDYFKKREFF